MPTSAIPGCEITAYVAAYVENQRRIVDLFQLRRVFSIFQSDYMHTCGRDARQFVLSQFQRTAGAQRLGRNRLQPHSLQFSQRSAKDALHSAEKLHQSAGFCRSQAWRKSQRKPLQRGGFGGLTRDSTGFRHIGLQQVSRGIFAMGKRLCQGQMTKSC